MSIEDGIGIDSDGMVEDPYQGIETYYAPMEDVAEVPEDRYLRITGDNGGTNVEIRVPFATLELNGWSHSTSAEGLLEEVRALGGIVIELLRWAPPDVSATTRKRLEKTQHVLGAIKAQTVPVPGATKET